MRTVHASRLFYLISFLLVATVFVLSVRYLSPKEVFDPHDQVARLDESRIRAFPSWGDPGKWVAFKAVDVDTEGFKPYFYKGVAFRLLYPKNFNIQKNGKGDKYPLLVFFPGGLENAPTHNNEAHLYHGATEFSEAVARGDFGGFVLYPLFSREGEGHVDIVRNNLAELIEQHLIPALNIDRSRILSHGFSIGSESALLFANRNPLLVAGVIIGSALPGSPLLMNGGDRSKFKPIRYLSGRLDRASAAFNQSMRDAFSNSGSNFHVSDFAWEGHRVWRSAWESPEFFSMIGSVHMANPWPLFGRRKVCRERGLTVEVGLTSGFDDYEWRRDGRLVSDARTSSLSVFEPGTYDVRYRRGDVWSDWSPMPLVVENGCGDYREPIVVSDFAGRALPSIGKGRQEVRLAVAAGYLDYQWLRNDEPIPNENKFFLLADAPGTYRARIEIKKGEYFFSDSFSIAAAFSPALSGIGQIHAQALTTTSVRLYWQKNNVQRAATEMIEVVRAEQKFKFEKVIASLPAPVTSYVDSSADDNAIYSYGVRLTKEDGEVLVSYVPYLRINNQNHLTISFSGNENREGRSLEVFREILEPEQPLTLIARIPATQTEYVDTHLFYPSDKYMYQLRVVGDASVSDISKIEFVSGRPDDDAPPRPEKLRFNQFSRTSGAIYWDRGNQGDDYRYVLQWDSSKPIEHPKRDVTVNLEEGRTYRFRVKAKDRAGNESAWTDFLPIRLSRNGIFYKYFLLDKNPSAVETFLTDGSRRASAYGRTAEISLAPRLTENNYVMTWEGYINIEKPGTYVFRIRSDGESVLTVGVADGLKISHAPGELVTESTGPVVLAKGAYPLGLAYMNRNFKGEVLIEWMKPGDSSYEKIPASIFFSDSE